MQPVIESDRRVSTNFKMMNGRARFSGIGIGVVACVVFGALFAGCAHHREFSGAEQRVMSSPPAFLTGPMALLLTNANSFNAQLSYETRTAWGSTQTVTGSFTGAGSKVAFQPALPKSSRKNTQARMSFVWDTAQGSGYAINDALQGYAPFSTNARFTNVVSSKLNSMPERISGYDCQEENATVLGTDGSINNLRVWRATDLRGFPLRISVGTTTNTAFLTLSKVQFGQPAEFLMSQEGFTKYDSPDAMVSELIARQHNLRREGQAFGSPDIIEQNRLRPPGQSY
jgi:hypothetical protein